MHYLITDSFARLTLKSVYCVVSNIINLRENANCRADSHHGKTRLLAPRFHIDGKRKLFIIALGMLKTNAYNMFAARDHVNAPDDHFQDIGSSLRCSLHQRSSYGIDPEYVRYQPIRRLGIPAPLTVPCHMCTGGAFDGFAHQREDPVENPYRTFASADCSRIVSIEAHEDAERGLKCRTLTLLSCNDGIGTSSRKQRLRSCIQDITACLSSGEFLVFIHFYAIISSFLCRCCIDDAKGSRKRDARLKACQHGGTALVPWVSWCPVQKKLKSTRDIHSDQPRPIRFERRPLRLWRGHFRGRLRAAAAGVTQMIKSPTEKFILRRYVNISGRSHWTAQPRASVQIANYSRFNS